MDTIKLFANLFFKCTNLIHNLLFLKVKEVPCQFMFVKSMQGKFNAHAHTEAKRTSKFSTNLRLKHTVKSCFKNFF